MHSKNLTVVGACDLQGRTWGDQCSKQTEKDCCDICGFNLQVTGRSFQSIRDARAVQLMADLLARWQIRSGTAAILSSYGHRMGALIDFKPLLLCSYRGAEYIRLVILSPLKHKRGFLIPKQKFPKDWPWNVILGSSHSHSLIIVFMPLTLRKFFPSAANQGLLTLLGQLESLLQYKKVSNGVWLLSTTTL